MEMKKNKSKEEIFFATKKYEDFICDFEDKWLQYVSAEERMKAFFGNLSNAENLFEKWQNGENLFEKEINLAFPEPYKFS